MKSLYPPGLDHILAKSADRSIGDAPETLAEHTWLVLSRLRDFIELRTGIPSVVEQPRLWHILYWGVFLHDFGKAMPGFQALLRGNKSFEPSWKGQRHEVFSLAFVDWISSAFTKAELLQIRLIVASHHKDFAYLFEIYPYSDRNDLAAHFNEFLHADVCELHIWLAEYGYSWAKKLGITQYGVERIVLCDEVAPDFIETAPNRIAKHLQVIKKYQKNNLWKTPEQNSFEIALRGMICNADHAASAHYPHPPKLSFTPDDVLTSRGIPRKSLHKHQEQAAQIIGSAVLIAPTGSGKTEAALLWAAHNLGAGANRLFYTLPYQASMNAMELRLKGTFDAASEIANAESKVGITHGRSTLAVFKRLMDQGYDAKAAKENARDLKNLFKLNYPPVRVSSPYQMLKAPFRLKGYEAQLVDYFNALFVFDEIHAYEVQRLAMILGLMQYLREHFQAKFFVMTATFPKILRAQLQNVLGAPPEIEASNALFKTFQRHRLQLIIGNIEAASSLQKIYAAALTGQAVLVVCNLVDKAQALYDYFAAKANGEVDVDLLHGRFNVRDRIAKEARINSIAGNTPRPRKPSIFIATQVVEVSLDVDFDTIFTEPAPLEALMQRFGRVNRKQKMPSLAVVHVFTEPLDGQYIYDERLVQNTLSVLQTVDGNPIDEDQVTRWLDQVYTEDYIQDWQSQFDAALQVFKIGCLEDLQAFHSEPALKQEFYDLFDSVEVLPDCYLAEYEALVKTRDMRARELLVPISMRRLWIIKNAKLHYRDCDVDIVDLPYSAERGLDYTVLKKD